MLGSQLNRPLYFQTLSCDSECLQTCIKLGKKDINHAVVDSLSTQKDISVSLVYRVMVINGVIKSYFLNLQCDINAFLCFSLVSLTFLKLVKGWRPILYDPLLFGRCHQYNLSVTNLKWHQDGRSCCTVRVYICVRRT